MVTRAFDVAMVQAPGMRDARMRPTVLIKRLSLPWRRLHESESEYAGQGETGQVCLQLNKTRDSSSYGSIGGIVAINHPLAFGRSVPVAGGPPGLFVQMLRSETLDTANYDFFGAAASAGKTATVTTNFDGTLVTAQNSRFYHVGAPPGFSFSNGLWTIPNGIWLVTVSFQFGTSAEATQRVMLYGETSAADVRSFSIRVPTSASDKAYVSWVVCVNSAQSTETQFRIRTTLSSVQNSVAFGWANWDKIGPVLTEAGTRPTAT